MISRKPADGYRVLVDRLWPRGLTKQKLQLDAWMKALAPSTDLRNWIHRDPGKWAEFKRRYFKQLEAQSDLLAALREKGRSGKVTLVYSARDTERNNATVLKEYLDKS
jgi:uncharacterized protein YeaO (DUF488 family)